MNATYCAACFALADQTLDTLSAAMFGDAPRSDAIERVLVVFGRFALAELRNRLAARPLCIACRHQNAPATPNVMPPF